MNYYYVQGMVLRHTMRIILSRSQILKASLESLIEEVIEQLLYQS